MIVYADVLICINIIIDYFLIGFAAAILKAKCSFRRQLLGAVVGGLCSLMILIERESLLISVFVRLITSFSVTMAAFGFLSIGVFIKRLGFVYLSSFAFSGAILALLELLKPVGLIIHNGIVYYDLSAMLLICLAAAIYGLLSLILRISKRKTEHICKIRISEGKTDAEIIALIDSGHKLREPFSEKWVLILDPKYSELLSPQSKMKRIIPYKTVSGGGALVGFLPDKIKLASSGEELDMYVAFSPEPLGKNYSAIIASEAI